MRSNRLFSFIVVVAIYAIATIFGIIIYKLLNYDFWLKFLISDVCATVIVFIFSLLFKNASCYDPYWSYTPMVVVVSLGLTFPLTPTRLLIIIAILVWGIRLTLNWAYTFTGLDHEDWRYMMLKEKSGKLYPFVNFLGIHLFPTLVVYLCMLPVMGMFYYDASINVLVIIFFVFALIAPSIELIADMQMHKFRKEKSGTFNRIGLWKYSRHPNYLGEIMMWISVALLAIAACGFKWYFIVGAIVNLLMFLFISIPMADNHQRSRKPGYDEYKKETRNLLPIKRFKTSN